MTYLEMFATLFTLICVALTVRRNIWAWPMGIIGVSAYFFVFYEVKLYADMGLQLVFLMQSIYGWWFWLHGKKEDDDHVPIRVLNTTERLWVMGIIGVVTLIIGSILSRFTDAAVPFLDAGLSSMSLVANMLLARKILDNWVLWIIADVAYVGLFYYKDLNLTAILYFIFFFMASNGFIQWRKEWQEQKA